MLPANTECLKHVWSWRGASFKKTVDFNVKGGGQAAMKQITRSPGACAEAVALNERTHGALFAPGAAHFRTLAFSPGPLT